MWRASLPPKPAPSDTTATLHDCSGASRSASVSRIKSCTLSMGAVHSMRKP